ncbi:MAG: tetratricopeptide repeat protein [Bacteroidota bacterium]
MGNNNNIPDSLITREELTSYIEGRLEPAENSRIASLIEQNEFLRDAVEGYQLNPGAIDDLDALHSTGLGTPPASSLFKNIFLSVIIAAPVITITLTAILLISGNLLPPVTYLKTDDKTTMEDIIPVAELTEIMDAEVIPETSLITSEKALENQAVTVQTIDEKSREYIMALNPKGPAMVDLTPNNEADSYSRLGIKYSISNFPVYYPENLKAVDYRKIHRKKIRDNDYELGSLDPKYANYEDKSNEFREIDEIFIPYDDFLRRTLHKFIRNNYKDALIDFKIILHNYPEDLNAYFYGGLCYYNIGKYDKAIDFFNFVLNHYITSFDEEAEWYKAKSLIGAGRTEEAKTLLMQIIEKDCFYSDRAKEELKMNE